MIYIISDTHGELTMFSPVAFVEEESWTKEDIVIVLGDFGFVDKPEYLDILEQKEYTIVFVDGNHEQFQLLNALPVIEMFGGKVHKVSENIYHLLRGEVYTIEEQMFFVFGGGYSRDRMYRIPNVSWFEEEIPTNTDYESAIQNLEKVNYTVDYIITHTAPRTLVGMMGFVEDTHEQELCGFLDYLLYKMRFQHWYFGHYHIDKAVTNHCTCVYNRLHQIKK